MPPRAIRAKHTAVAIALLLGVTACATPDARESFEEVSATVAERTGQRIEWRQGGPEDEAADAAVATLLGDGLTVDEAVQIALLNNRQLQATYQELGLAQANLVQAGLLRNPIFDAAATFPIGGGVVDLELALVQDFLDVLALPLRRKVAASQLEEAKLRVTAAVLDHAGATRAAFYRLQGAEQLLALRQEIAAASAASLAAMERLHEAGNVRKLDVDSERLLAERARLDVDAATLAVLDAREALNRAMGLWGPQTDWQAEPQLPDLPAAGDDVAEIEALAVAASTDLALLRQEIETVGRRAGVRNLEALLGDLELGATAERDDREWEAGPTVNLAVPLFDRGQARRAAARAELNRKLDQYYARAVEIRSLARDARQRLETARARALGYRDIVLPLEANVGTELQLQYNAMQIGLFDLLTAKERQIRTGVAAVEALRDYWLARVALGQMLSGRPPPDAARLGPGDEPGAEAARFH